MSDGVWPADGEASELSEGKGKCYVVEGRAIAVFLSEGNYYALDDLCTHADAFTTCV